MSKIIILCLFFLTLIIYKRNINIKHNYLFVTAYFQILKNLKHDINKYKLWIANFFKVINSSLAIFTDNNKSSKSFIPSFVEAYKYEYQSIWDVPCIKKYRKLYFQQHKIDPEKFRHSPDAYAIWNSKICFLEIAASQIDSDLYIWIDIGTFRNFTLNNIFPSFRALKILYSFTSMFFFTIANRSYTIDRVIKLEEKDWIGGNSFGGKRKYIHEYYKEYWKLHDFFLYRNRFVGKEQILYNTMALYKYNATLIKMHDLNMCMKNVWWRYQCLYSGLNINYLKRISIDKYIYRTIK